MSHTATEVCFQLNRLAVEVTGSTYLRSLVEDELASLPPAEQPPRVSFDFVESLPGRQYARTQVILPEVSFGDGIIHVTQGWQDYTIERADEHWRVTLAPPPRDTFNTPYRAYFRQLKNWNFLSYEEEISKGFFYNIFDYIIQLSQLDLGQSFIHASSFVYQDRGVLLSAWGGIGKTTLQLRFVLQHGAKFLSDDLGLIDEDGTLGLTPKKLQIYGYNVLGERGLQDRLLRGRSLADRANWHLRNRFRGPRLVRRRVSPSQLFGSEALAGSAKLAHAFHLERAKVAKIELRRLPQDEFARRAAATVMHELAPYSHYAWAARACDIPALPDPAELEARTHKTIKRGVSGVQPYLLTMPHDASPTDLTAYLKRVLDHGL